MFDNSYIKLPERFYESINPEKLSNPKLIKFNEKLAKELKLELDEKDLTEIFSGQKLMEGSKPIAQAYAGHQFGHFVPQLGDGRAHLLGEIIDKNGERRDIQLKGSGITKFSRGGDGKAWLGSVIREYIVSEAMNALKIPSTRALAAVSTGEEILREKRLPGAIFTRVAASHVRVGTFEYFAARKDHEAIKILADYVIERHYPELKNDYLGFFKAFAKKQSELISKWMSVGFIHGVMNTDNCSLSGETIDYGPCAFMDFFDYQQIFSSIDQHGRYAYGNQPNIILWNISCLGNTLISLIDEDQKKAIEILNEAMGEITADLEKSVKLSMVKKLGFEELNDENSQLLIDFLAILQKYRADFTLAFRSLSDLIEEGSNTEKFISLFDDKEHKDEVILNWLSKWRKLNPDLDFMNKVNPVYIPRNHLVEKAIEEAYKNNDYRMMNDLIECLENPFTEQEKFKEFAKAPESKD